MKPCGLHKRRCVNCIRLVSRMSVNILSISFEEGELDEDSVVRNFRTTEYNNQENVYLCTEWFYKSGRL